MIVLYAIARLRWRLKTKVTGFKLLIFSLSTRTYFILLTKVSRFLSLISFLSSFTILDFDLDIILIWILFSVLNVQRWCLIRYLPSIFFLFNSVDKVIEWLLIIYVLLDWKLFFVKSLSILSCFKEIRWLFSINNLLLIVVLYCPAAWGF